MGRAAQDAGAGIRCVPTGPTSLYVLEDDPRFSYCLYVPPKPVGGAPRKLLVAVHGTERDAVGMRDSFVSFAETHHLWILSPLFPAGIDDPDDLDNYKFIRFGRLRFDELLLQMVASAERRLGARFGARFDPAHLVGFSGGAQFVHRFTYLHPEEVASASIAAPGRITLLDETRDWWDGTRDIAKVFGNPLDLEAIRTVPVQVVVGADDIGDAAHPRVSQARILHDNYRAMGISSRLDVVPRAHHELARLIPSITDFLGGQLRNTGRFVS